MNEVKTPTAENGIVDIHYRTMGYRANDSATKFVELAALKCEAVYFKLTPSR